MSSAPQPDRRTRKISRTGARTKLVTPRRSAVAGLVLAAALGAFLAARPATPLQAALTAAADARIAKTTAATSAPVRAAATTAPALSVRGNHFVNSAGRVVQLRGVNRSSFVGYCAAGYGFAQGPVTQAGVNAIHSWGVNMVRLQLNEDCWLGINGMPAAYSGANYRNAVANYVRYANNDRMYVVLSLAWNAPGTAQSVQQQPMADQSHAPAFWRSVAARFGHNKSVIFDLYNEPRPDYDADSAAAFKCIRDGGTCPGVGFAAAGMQELVNLVRHKGATNILLIGGANSAELLDHWLRYRPADPLHKIAASVHVYDASPYNTSALWNAYIAPVAAKVPVITGEMGELPAQTTGCRYSFSPSYTAWADAHGVSYAAFDWDAWPQCDALITNYNGTPTWPYGAGWKAHFLTDQRRHPA